MSQCIGERFAEEDRVYAERFTYGSNSYYENAGPRHPVPSHAAASCRRRIGRVCIFRQLRMRLLEMTKYCKIYEVIKTICVEVDNAANANHVHFDFTVMILRLKDEEYAVQVYRRETIEIKTISGALSDDEVLVRDFFLVNDLLRFKSEAEAAGFITKRLDELFG